MILSLVVVKVLIITLVSSRTNKLTDWRFNFIVCDHMNSHCLYLLSFKTSGFFEKFFCGFQFGGNYKAPGSMPSDAQLLLLFP